MDRVRSSLRIEHHNPHNRRGPHSRVWVDIWVDGLQVQSQVLYSGPTQEAEDILSGHKKILPNGDVVEAPPPSMEIVGPLTVGDMIQKLGKFNKELPFMILDSYNGGGYPRETNLGPILRTITTEDSDNSADCEDLEGRPVVTVGFGCY